MTHLPHKISALALAVAFAAALLPASKTPAAADRDSTAATMNKPGTFAAGIHSPVTHLYEVTNAAVLHDTALDTVKGTLAERADTRPASNRPVTTAQAAK